MPLEGREESEGKKPCEAAKEYNESPFFGTSALGFCREAEAWSISLFLDNTYIACVEQLLKANSKNSHLDNGI